MKKVTGFSLFTLLLLNLEVAALLWANWPSTREVIHMADAVTPVCYQTEVTELGWPFVFLHSSSNILGRGKAGTTMDFPTLVVDLCVAQFLLVATYGISEHIVRRRERQQAKP